MDWICSLPGLQEHKAGVNSLWGEQRDLKERLAGAVPCSRPRPSSVLQGFSTCLRVSVTLSPQFVLMLNSGIIKAVPLIQKKQAMRATLRLHACVYTHGRVLHVSDACGFDTPEHLFFPAGTADPELFGAQNHAGFSDMWECRLKATHSLGSGRRGLLTHSRAILHSWQSSEGTGDWIP